jgi:hypothetical protein
LNWRNIKLNFKKSEKRFLFIFILYYFANGKVFLKFYEWIKIA